MWHRLTPTLRRLRPLLKLVYQRRQEVARSPSEERTSTNCPPPPPLLVNKNSATVYDGNPRGHMSRLISRVSLTTVYPIYFFLSTFDVVMSSQNSGPSRRRHACIATSGIVLYVRLINNSDYPALSVFLSYKYTVVVKQLSLCLLFVCSLPTRRFCQSPEARPSFNLSSVLLHFKCRSTQLFCCCCF